MSTKTQNFDLIKAELTDSADITAFNANWDKIDSELVKKYDPNNKPTVNDIGGVPNNRTVNGKALSGDITLSAEDVNAAEAEHNHSTADITSGTLGVSRGGTGITSNPSMLTNLGSTSATSVFAKSPRPGVTGTLPIANGGTGSKTASDALTALGAAPTSHNHSASNITSGTLSVARGGTGATTLAAALTALYGGTQNAISSVTNYLDLPYGVTEGVYSSLKTNDPFTETGAKRVFALRISGSSSSISFILAICLDGGNDSGRAFEGYVSGTTVVWRELFSSSTNSVKQLSSSLESLMANGGMSTLQSAIQITNASIYGSNTFTGTGKGKLFVYSSGNSPKPSITIDGKVIGDIMMATNGSFIEIEFLKSFSVINSNANNTSPTYCNAIFY